MTNLEGKDGNISVTIFFKIKNSLYWNCFVTLNKMQQSEISTA